MGPLGGRGLRPAARATANIKLAVCVLIVHEAQVLLKRNLDYRGSVHYRLPSGFVMAGERIRDAAFRVIRRDTGLAIDAGILLFIADRSVDDVDTATEDRPDLFFYFRSNVRGIRPDIEKIGSLKWVDMNRLNDGWFPIPALAQVLQNYLNDNKRDAMIDGY